MNEIKTIAERDALPVGSIVIDAYAATCIRARMSDPPAPSDWVRVTTAVKGGEHHHSPFLPADVERIGWSDYKSTPDAPARTDPTSQPTVAEVKAEAWDEGVAWMRRHHGAYLQQVAEAAAKAAYEAEVHWLPNIFGGTVEVGWDDISEEERQRWRNEQAAALAVIVPAVTEQVRALHTCSDSNPGEAGREQQEAGPWLGDCKECWLRHPCPTLRLLDELDAAARGEQP